MSVIDTRTVTRGTTTTDIFDDGRIADAVSSVVSGSIVYTPYNASTGLGDYEVVTVRNSSAITSSLVWHGTHQPAAAATYVVTYVVNADFILKGVDFLKAAMVKCLRVAFQTQTYYTDLTYNANDTLSKIMITESFPRRVVKSPMIIVSAGTGNVNRNTLHPSEEMFEVRDTSGDLLGYRCTGKLNITMRIEVYATQNADERKLTDLVWFFCRNMFAYTFASYGIGFKDFTLAGEDAMAWQGQLLHKNAVIIPCYSEFQAFYPLTLMDALTQLNVTLKDELSDMTLNLFTVPEP